MRLVTFATEGHPERVGALLEDGAVLDLTGAAGEAGAFRSMRSLINAGECAWGDARTLAAAAKPEFVLGVGAWRLRAPLPRPAQFRDSMCFGRHIEQGAKGMAALRARMAGDTEALPPDKVELPPIYAQQPVWYKGNRFNVSDPGADIAWPPFSAYADFELELACVIGRKGRDLSPERALEHVFGYTIFNDFSARDVQAMEVQGFLGPAKAKDFDGANVFGPCIVTADEIGDPNALRMIARVNGEVWCDSSSATMTWSFAELIAYISRGETLHPGEVIASGTVGDGCGLEHFRFLKSGDVVELEIEKIGVLANRVVFS
jgi:2-keto-4-pentenoate hydratase/2-oxohepta-3-ene-1,7-dioic acid hydratase in catechol pathway